MEYLILALLALAVAGVIFWRVRASAPSTPTGVGGGKGPFEPVRPAE